MPKNYLVSQVKTFLNVFVRSFVVWFFVVVVVFFFGRDFILKYKTTGKNKKQNKTKPKNNNDNYKILPRTIGVLTPCCSDDEDDDDVLYSCILSLRTVISLVNTPYSDLLILLEAIKIASLS